MEARLGEQWSPEQIAGSMKAQGYPLVSHEWIYQHVLRDKAAGGVLYKELRHRCRKYRKRYGSGPRRSRIPNRVGIEQRPAVVDERSRLGDWEGDTVVGTGLAALVTLVERKNGIVLLCKVSRATAELTATAIVDALGPWDPLTVTFDNGTEFAQHERVAQELDCDIYFARPYHSWERGTNENANGLVRQYFPKGTDFSYISDAEIKAVQDKLNMRPRKLVWLSGTHRITGREPDAGGRCS